MTYMIKYKAKGKWYTHNRKYTDIPIKYKTKEGAKKATTKHSFGLVYQTNPLKIVQYEK